MKVVGMIEGRHPLPVESYIFSEIRDVLDFGKIRERVESFLCENFPENSGSLTVYVTGLTSVTAEIIAACFRHGVALTLMHFNRETGEYQPQALDF